MKALLLNSFVFILFFSFFSNAYAGVIINEVAWMGTSESANDEWIELYNDGAEDISLDGWILDAIDGSPLVSLSGKILGGEFYLLERSNDSTVPSAVADLIYTGALSNTGEHLRLKNAQGEVVHEVGAQDGWQGGDNVTKNTLQWSGTSWVTSVPTPKVKNGTENIESSSLGNEDDTEAGLSKNSGGTTGGGSVVPSVHISPLPLSDVSDIRTVLVSAGAKRVVTVGQNVPFFAFRFDEDKKRIKGGAFLWSFGDGGSAMGEEVLHTYYYPGTYVVALNTPSYDDGAVARTEILVTKPELEIVSLGKEDERTFVEVKNKSSHDINLYEWELLGDSAQSFIFPKDTILKAHSSVSYPEEITGVLAVNTARLLNQQKKEVVRFEKGKEENIFVPVVVPATMQAKIIVPSPAIIATPVPNKKETKETKKIAYEVDTGQTALVSESFTVEKTRGPFMRFLILPVRLVRSIGGLF